ncbi:DNA-directed RNA polymerase III subunit RPC3 [[Candida] jaroonii]|uniref:DNA-directed RNA polymerase III subunit RPC3 n=1 Tax=[Candida] jaroonii TaxID=467808 RepID=A0ACA9Y0N6_9ASCO|nr:DNA-directed RNA polymerase III subunit RPC3 [[Candida] jaroonii]
MVLNVPPSAETQSPLSNLLTLVAKEHLGEVPAIIISTLISHGRLTAKEISRRSKVPIKLVKTTLVSLIQLNCMLYWVDKDKVEYQFQDTGLFVFLHSGEIITHIKNKYDEECCEIIQNLIQLGNIKVSDYLKSFDDETRYSRSLKLSQLFGDGWIKILQPHDFNPLEDVWNKIYHETTKNVPRSATLSEVKRVAEIKELSKEKLSHLLENLPKDLYTTVDGMKGLNPKLSIGFNFKRFEKFLRSKALIALCESRVGRLSAEVYKVVLEILEKQSPDPKPYINEIDGIINTPEEKQSIFEQIENKLIDNKSLTAKIHDIVKKLPQTIDLNNSILTHNFVKPATIKKRVVSFSEIERTIKKPKIKMEDNEAIIEMDEDDNDYHTPTNGDGNTNLVIQHLKLLAFSTKIPFIMEIGNGSFTVPYNKLNDIVKEYTYDELIKKSLGVDSLRILRCIRSLKLVDEKTVSNSVLLKEKVVRNEIYKLIQLNVIEIQEIPRSNDRAASKTFFAFRYKNHSNYQFLRNSLIHNISSILHNIEDFKFQHKSLLEKCQREDVKGNEQELLLESELRILNQLQSREINNIGKLNRLLSLLEIFN